MMKEIENLVNEKRIVAVDDGDEAFLEACIDYVGVLGVGEQPGWR